MEKIKQLEREHLRMDLPDFGPGDTVKVFVKIKEGEIFRFLTLHIPLDNRGNIANSQLTRFLFHQRSM